MSFNNIVTERDTILAKSFDFKKYLDTGDNGIETSSVPSREETYGKNEIIKCPPKTFSQILWNSCKDPLIILLSFSATIALTFGLVFEEQRNHNEWVESIAIWLAIIIIVSIGTITDYKQEKAFHKLNKKNDEYDVKVIRDGQMQQISNKSLVVGDVMLLESGDKIPVDGYILETFSLGIDESSLTGENITVVKDFENDPWFRSGSVVTEGRGKMIVTTVGMNSEYGKTISIVQQKTEKTPLQKRLTRFVKWCGIFASILSVIVFTVLTIRWAVSNPRSDFTSGPLKYVIFSITILVIGLPEGLPAAVMITLSYSMKKMLKDNNFVRHMAACETLGSTSMLLSDKTGTLTENKMTVVKGVFAGKMYDHVPPIGDMKTLFDDIFTNCSVNSSAFIKGGVGVGSQTECALINFVNSYGASYEAIRAEYNDKITDVVPFSSKTKMSSVSIDGIKYTKGASEIVLGMCSKMYNGNEIVDIDVEMYKNFINQMASSGLRTIGLTKNDAMMCVVGIKDPVRNGVPMSIKSCSEAGIGVIMVTGDNIDTAKHIAKEIGVLKPGDVAICGSEFRSMTKDQQIAIAPKLRVLARSSPEDKYNLTKLMKEIGHICAVSGDGTNDAPALKESDVGVAMGISGTDISKEAADIIVLDDNFNSIVRGVLWGRTIMSNIRSFITFQLPINFVALLVVAVAAFARGETPLNVIQLLYVNLIMDSVAAVALATIPPNEKLMKKKPGPRNEFIVTMDMLRNIIPQSLYQLLAQFLIYFMVPVFWDISEKQMSGFMFNTFIFCQVFNLINVHASYEVFPIFTMFKKYVSLACISMMIVFQFFIVFLMPGIFKIEKLNTTMWLISTGVGFGSIIVHAIVTSVSNWVNEDD